MFNFFVQPFCETNVCFILIFSTFYYCVFESPQEILRIDLKCDLKHSNPSVSHKLLLTQQRCNLSRSEFLSAYIYGLKVSPCGKWAGFNMYKLKSEYIIKEISLQKKKKQRLFYMNGITIHIIFNHKKSVYIHKSWF